MAHIVCITSGLTGIMYASFELVARLRAEGHQLTYASPNAIGEQVQAQNIPYIQLPPLALTTVPDLPQFNGPMAPWNRWLYKLRWAKTRRQQALGSVGMEAIDEHLKQLAPDLLILDVELHEYIFTAFSRAMPFVLLSQWFSLWKRPGLPYLLHDTIPGEGWRGQHWAIALSWWFVKRQRSWMFFKKKIRSAGTDRRSILRLMAQKLNFPSAYIKDNYWPGPFTYNTLPVLSMTAWEMEFPHKKRANLHYIGPMVHTTRKDTHTDQKLQQQLAQIFAHRREQNAALIYCSVSSMKKGDEFFLKKVCEAVAAEPNWILILGLGGLVEEQFLETIPKNIYPFSWVPQLRVLEQADCSINHGGIHTINECLHYQVPMLVYSGKRSDQNGCAARVAYHQLGIRGDKDRDSPAMIRSKLKAILSDKGYRDRMKKMHDYYRAYQEKACLERFVDGFLQDEKSCPGRSG